MDLKRFLSYFLLPFAVLGSFSVTAEEKKAVIVSQEESSIQRTQRQLEEQFGKDSAVLISYQRLVKAVEGKVSDKEMQEIAQAILFAAKAHQDKTRKHEPKTPYLCYPLDVAYDLVTVAKIYNKDALVGAILHDTLRGNEEGAVLKDVEKQFGSSIANVVKELGRYPVSTQEKQQHLLMAHASQESKIVAEIQLANLLYNLQELVKSPPPKWSQEKKDHYVQFAHAFLERLRDKSPELSQAVEKQIQAYWDAQNRS